MGLVRLTQTAKADFGVDMTVDEARDLKRRICEEIYPEIGKHLSEDGYRILAYDLDSDVEKVCGRLPVGCQLGSTRKIISGKDSSAELSEDYADNLWDGLASLCNRTKLRGTLELRQAGDDLTRDLMNFPAVHHLRFARGRTDFCSRKNFPFRYKDRDLVASSKKPPEGLLVGLDKGALAII